jgi:hypothetical protein
MRRVFHLLLILSFLWSAKLASAAVTASDLIVYGATPAGIITAVSASRNGLHVTLIDAGHHIGGLVAGGLSSTDHGNVAVIGGLSRDFFARVGGHYGEPVEWNFEPHVATQVFTDLLTEAHVNLILDAPVREKGGVQKEGTRVVSITTEDGRVFRAKLFADCSYEGVVMGQAGVTYTWGRESSTQYGESLAGVRGQQRLDHHFTVRVSPYEKGGSLLPEVQPGPKGKLGDGDKKVQAYGFRICITHDPENGVTFPKPPGYDPHRYEILTHLIDALTAKNGKAPVMKQMILMSALKGGKIDVNSLGAVSTDHIGASWNFPTADAQQRNAIWQDHYNYETGFFYFLANDPKVPAPLRDEVASYGLAKDEFTDTGNWPWQLYIRESRRMVGVYVMTQKDIQTDLGKDDAIGMGSYESDSHGVERIPTPDGAVENEGEMYTPTKPYQIPYRLILPRRTETSNLFVPVCFSASHVAYSTLRMEPQYMIIGQAAGVAAALALHRKQSIYDLSIPDLQKQLRAEHVVLSLDKPAHAEAKNP